MLDDDEIEPAAAAFATGRDADFVADGLEFFAVGVELFSGEGATGRRLAGRSGNVGCLDLPSNSSCVGFDDADDFSQGSPAQVEPGYDASQTRV